jgi:hypothetical protein
MQLSALSLEYVRVPVSATLSGVATNPTTDTVQMAFPATGVDPVAGDWKAATWEPDTSVTPNVYYARCLVGPGGTVTLAVGRWDVWLKVSDNPEIPARKAGLLQIV